MAAPRVTGIHLVGSSGLSTVEETFRTFSSALKPHLRRISDGEPGERYNFVGWQFAKPPPALLKAPFRPQDAPALTDDAIEAAFAALQCLETDYDTEALKSYKAFKDLKQQGIIPDAVRFQVCFPTALSFTALAVTDEHTARFECLYEAAIMRALRQVQDSIPAAELAIQWDAPIEFLFLERSTFYGNEVKPWFDPVHEGILERLLRLGHVVDTDVELGYHLCYGDVTHKHFVEPDTTRYMADVAEALLKRCERYVAWIHMPVPKDRADRAYFEPLQRLMPLLKEKNTELSLGVVHADDLLGTRARIRTAGEFAPTFSVATECGLGRMPPERLQSILDISAAVADEGGLNGDML